MRRFLSQVPRILTAMPFACLLAFVLHLPRLCFTPNGPPPQLFLYIWSQEGALGLPWGIGTHSCVPSFLRKNFSLEILEQSGLGQDNTKG